MTILNTYPAALKEYIQTFLTGDDLNNAPITRGLVLALFHDCSENHIAVFERIHSIAQHQNIDCDNLKEASIRLSICRVNSQLMKYKKNITRNWHEIQKYLNESFGLPSTKTQPRLQPRVEQDVLPAPVKKIKTDDCEICATLSTELKQAISKLKESEKLKLENIVLRKKIQQYCPRRINQFIKRKNIDIANKKGVIMEQQKALQKLYESQLKNRELQNEVRKLKRQNKKYRQTCREPKHVEMEKVVTELNDRVVALEVQLGELQDCYGDGEVIYFKDKKQYSSQIRKCMYFALQHQCPVQHTSAVVKFIVEEMTHKQIEQMPSISTVSRMALEPGVISDLQSGEILESTPSNTLAWDATDIDGKHINEVHACTVDSEDARRQYLSLGLAELSGGRAGDYHRHIMETLQDVTKSYAEWSEKDPYDVLKATHNNISNTIGDRVAVNHSVVEHLEQTLGKHLTELNCNVHPLDSLARKTRNVLKTHSDAKGLTFGRDCAAVNVIYGLHKMRYKQGKGDPKSFKAFFKSRGVPLKTFPRYVGNRLHIVFHLAGVYHKLHHLVVEYLERYCNQTGCLKNALLQDMRNPLIQRDLQIIGLFGKVVTGPWMTKFYSDETGIGNLDLNIHLEQAVESLASYSTDPDLLLTSPYDVFGEVLDVNDGTLQSLHQQTHTIGETFRTLVVKVAEQMKVVVDRQLVRYLSGDLSEPTEELKQQTKSAPLHNIQAERIMAMMDSEARRVPNATISFVESKIKARVNNSLDWLTNKPEKQQESIVSYAVGRAARLSKIKKDRAKRTDKEVLQRMKEKTQMTDDALSKQFEREVEKLDGSADSDTILSLAPELSQEDIEEVLNMLRNPESLVGQKIDHIWWKDHELGNETYYGQILKLKKTKVCTFVVGYWEAAEMPDDMEDFNIKRSQIISDFVFGNLHFLWWTFDIEEWDIVWMW